MSNTFRLTIVTPEHQFFDDDVESLIVEAPDGEYAVLAGHEPVVISMIEGEIRFTQNGETRWAAASSGFATIVKEAVLVMLQTCEWPEEIDIKRAERDRHAAQEQLRQQKSQQEYLLARSMLARAMTRLRVSGKHRIND